MSEEENKESPPSTDDSPQQEAQLNNPSTDETIAKAEQPITHNPQPVTEQDMEVHHHAHDPAAPHHKKNWKNYFWEFLMLFLAVFCGFFAEYQLEHKIEKDREKQFMQSLVEDLKSDIVSITSLNQWRDTRLQMADSLTNTLIENKQLQNGSEVYYWGRSISRRGVFFSADGTIQQLKNSGGLRLIRNQSIADKIIGYDVLYRRILRQQEQEETLLTDYRFYSSKLFDAAVFKKMTNLMKDTVFVAKPEGNPQLKENPPTVLNETINKLNYWATSSTLLRQFLEQLKEKAAILIELIQKEYHLK
ncbi:hypothetical protein [Lacibacter sediminis]|uniref:Uncharacterized protein n=1 Tax=Lacibacter sediminis TaxID=2760713 RepID=A0A7G5XGE4_9BACT|nr:hypothetical protein [Lacibacter sediminis]QNA44547.1 hypothetical protein H4075_21220 [Lacibacter sediminis]